MNLSTIEYDVIMQAINNAKNEIHEDTLIDPYADNIEGYTNEMLLQALERVENKIIRTARKRGNCTD
jgi:ribosome-binding ATPase YchF (GTP1/OBG family)